jgi:DNA-binding HxlR family transcriptional regulator
MEKLTPNQVWTRHRWLLEAIDLGMKEHRSPTAKELAECKQISRSYLSEVLTGLELDGYITKIVINEENHYVLANWGYLTLETRNSEAFVRGLVELGYKFER